MMGLFAVTMGSKLSWDAGKEQYINDNAANAMLSRPFREKWIDRHVVDWMNKYQEVSMK
jgi:hypothetical protein